MSISNLFTACFSFCSRSESYQPSSQPPVRSSIDPESDRTVGLSTQRAPIRGSVTGTTESRSQGNIFTGVSMEVIRFSDSSAGCKRVIERLAEGIRNNIERGLTNNKAAYAKDASRNSDFTSKLQAIQQEFERAVKETEDACDEFYKAPGGRGHGVISGLERKDGGYETACSMLKNVAKKVFEVHERQNQIIEELAELPLFYTEFLQNEKVALPTYSQATEKILP